MSVFVDFVGLNTIVSSSFVTGTFDNIISSGRNDLLFPNQPGYAAATGEIDFDASPSPNDTITLNDGGPAFNGGVGSVTFTYVNVGSDLDEIVRDGTIATATNNTVTKINNYPGLNLVVSQSRSASHASNCYKRII